MTEHSFSIIQKRDPSPPLPEKKEASLKQIKKMMRCVESCCAPCVVMSLIMGRFTRQETKVQAEMEVSHHPSSLERV